jgi:hypothetical protein
MIYSANIGIDFAMILDAAAPKQPHCLSPQGRVCGCGAANLRIIKIENSERINHTPRPALDFIEAFDPFSILQQITRPP